MFSELAESGVEALVRGIVMGLGFTISSSIRAERPPIA
jgi:hypothetical protein